MLLHPTVSQITSSLNGLNPNADVFQSACCPVQANGSAELASPSATTHWPDTPLSELAITNITTGSVGVNGVDLRGSGMVQMAVVYPSSTPVASSPVSPVNGSQIDLHLPASSVVYTTTTDEQAANDDSTVLEDFLPADQLRTMLKTQLEYYFSRENLANDTYLVSQMDADQFVPVTTVASFNQVKRLTHNIELIVDVLRESANVQVDDSGEKVRPMHKRCIVILREIPDSTPIEEVENLFSGQACPKLLSCQFAHNNSWYVTFETEEDAQKAYRYLREEVRTFHGIPIMARIKAKPLQSSVGFVAKEAMKPHYDTSVYTSSKYTYSSPVPSIQYITPQHLPFFSPHTTISPLWSASVAYFDPGMAFAANGYIPTAAFVPPPATLAQGIVQPSRIRTLNNCRLDNGDATNSNYGGRRAGNAGGWNSTNESCNRNQNEEVTSYDHPRRPPRYNATPPAVTRADFPRGGGAMRGGGSRNTGGVPRTSYSSDGTDVFSSTNNHSPDNVGTSLSASIARDRGFAANRSAASYNKSGRRRSRNSAGDSVKSTKEVDSAPLVFELEEKCFPPLPGSSAPLLQPKAIDPKDGKISDVVRGADRVQNLFKDDPPPLRQPVKTTPPRASTVSICPQSQSPLSSSLRNNTSDSSRSPVKGTTTCVNNSAAKDTDAKLSYAQMALRGKERHQEVCSAPAETVAAAADASPSTLREQQTTDIRTPTRSKRQSPSAVAVVGSAGRRSSKENRCNDDECQTKTQTVVTQRRGIEVRK